MEQQDEGVLNSMDDGFNNQNIFSGGNSISNAPEFQQPQAKTSLPHLSSVRNNEMTGHGYNTHSKLYGSRQQMDKKRLTSSHT